MMVSQSRLAYRLNGINESATLAVTARAKALKAQGVDVVSFGAGEPDFDTPEHVKAAAKAALDAGDTKYAPVAGTAALRATVCEWMSKHYDLRYNPSNVIIGLGGKHALYTAFAAVINPGDEVVIPAPYWVSIPEMVRLTGGTPVIIDCPDTQQFKLTPDQLRAALSESTKVVYLNSPSNPTGVVYTREELAAIADVLVDFPHVLIFSDEIYEKLVYPPYRFTSFATLRPELRERLLVFSGMSKTFSMTGWRVGWTIGPADIVSAMATVQSHSTSNAVSFCMAASVDALKHDLDFLRGWTEQFRHRGARMTDGLNRLPGVTCVQPGGAFYCFPNVGRHYGRTIGGMTIHNSGDFCTALLETAHVAMVPGDSFGADKHVRLSFATSMEQIDKGLARLARALA